MICKNCNQEYDDNASFCPHCGTVTSAQEQPAQQTNEPNAQNQAAYNTQPAYTMPPAPPAINQTPYLVWSILVTVLCCLPFGIAAIVYATKISSALVAGNYQLAQDSAKKSKMFCIIGACVGAALVIIYFIFMFAIGIGISKSYPYSYY